jgi:hypothetical protein
MTLRVTHVLRAPTGVACDEHEVLDLRMRSLSDASERPSKDRAHRHLIALDAAAGSTCRCGRRGNRRDSGGENGDGCEADVPPNVSLDKGLPATRRLSSHFPA